MINLKISPFLVGKEHAIKLEEFEPNGGYELFLKDVCLYLGAIFVKWHQGIKIGVSEIFYKDYKMTVVWIDFPEHLSFDCENKGMAEQLKKNWRITFICTKIDMPLHESSIDVAPLLPEKRLLKGGQMKIELGNEYYVTRIQTEDERNIYAKAIFGELREALIAVSTETNSEKTYTFRELHREVCVIGGDHASVGRAAWRSRADLHVDDC